MILRKKIGERKFFIIAVAAVLIFVLGIYFLGGATVSARGSSVLEVESDEAIVNLNIESREDSAQDAKNNVSEISDRVLADLKNLGLEDKVELQGYNIYPDYIWNDDGREENGYVASQQISVTLEDFDLIAEVLDVSVDSGALVSYISFELSDERRSELKSEALKKAGEDAREKAQATASGLGKNIGRLVSVKSEDFGFVPYVVERQGLENAVAEGEVMNIAPSSLEVSATVEVEYKLTLF